MDKRDSTLHQLLTTVFSAYGRGKRATVEVLQLLSFPGQTAGGGRLRGQHFNTFNTWRFARPHAETTVVNTSQLLKGPA